MLCIKRVYEAPQASDGCRILVDRLWPRGLKKEAAALTDWRRSIAPSDELRRAFAHDPARFDAFSKEYKAALDADPAALLFAEECRTALATGTVTLLYAAKDKVHNNAAVLKEWLEEHYRSSI